jgi:hypothetical protein
LLEPGALRGLYPQQKLGFEPETFLTAYRVSNQAVGVTASARGGIELETV